MTLDPSRLRVAVDDITTLSVAVIVNAANERLLGGSGVDGAIHRAAGPELLEACRQIPEVRPGVRCPTGEARLTDGFDLPARYVIHTVGPVWDGGAQGEEEALANCYRNSLRLAAEREDIETVAFPAISTGVYGYPPDQAARVAVASAAGFLLSSDRPREVVFCCFSDEAAQLHRAAMKSLG